MKLVKILILTALSATFTLSAFAADSSSGCGLGWEVSQKQSLLSSSIRSTTNAFLPNTFSMTSGTSGCAKHEIVKNEREQQYFVESNLDQLTVEMAQGDGAYLRGFAVVMGCEGAYGEFSGLVQKNYSKTFSGTATPASVLSSVKAGIQSDSKLSHMCGATI